MLPENLARQGVYGPECDLDPPRRAPDIKINFAQRLFNGNIALGAGPRSQ